MTLERTITRGIGGHSTYSRDWPREIRALFSRFRDDRHEKVRIVFAAGMDYVPTLVNRCRVAVCVHFLRVEKDIAALQNQPQLFALFKQCARRPDLNFYWNDFTRFEFYYSFVLVEGLERSGFVLVEFAVRYPQPA